MSKVYSITKAKVILLFLSGFLIFGFSLGLSQAKSESDLTAAPPISIDFQDADLKDVLKVFSQQAGLNFIASENVKDRKVTLYLEKVSVEDALNTIMSANNLIYEQKQDSSIFVVKEWGRPEIETVIKVFPLQYARVRGYELDAGGKSGRSSEEAGIKQVLDGLVSEHGRVIEDARTNSLIVSDVPSQFANIEKAIKELDVKLPQVLIEAEVIETTLDAVDKLGIEWGSATDGELMAGFGSARTTDWPFVEKGEGVGPGGNVSGLYKGYLSALNLGGALDMLSKDIDTRILARPRVLTLNNETAEIKITADTAVASITETTSSEGIATQSVTAERVETGVSLSVTPQINRAGEITMVIEPSVTNTKQSTYFSSFVDPQKRSVKTSVTVRDGDTIIIGGLIHTEDEESMRKVPFLGDIPFIGNIFRKKEEDIMDKELIIFITPHLVSDAQPIPGLALEREQPWEYEVLDLKEEAMEMILDSFEE